MLNLDKNEKSLLEIAYYILDFGEYHPIVFSHDERYNKMSYLQYNRFFLDVISIFSSIGIYVDLEKREYNHEVNQLLNCLTDNDNYFFWYYKILMVDYSSIDVLKEANSDHPLVRLFAFLHNGASVDKQAMSIIMKKELSSNDVTQLKKIFKDKTFAELESQKDNSYKLKRESL